MSDPTFQALFIEEVARLLAIFDRHGGSQDARAAAVADVAQAAMLLDPGPAASRAAQLCRRLEAGDEGAADELAALAREMREALEPSEPSPPRRARASKEARATFDTEESQTLRSFFRDEAHQHLEKMVAEIAELGDRGPRPEQLDELLRVTHMLKGSAGTVGLPAFADAAHHLEEVLARARRGRLGWSTGLADRVVETIDALLAYVDAVDAPHRIDAAGAELELRAAALDRLWEPPGDDASSAAAAPAAPMPADDTASVAVAPAPGERVQPPVLRVDPRRIDRLMDGIAELTFDRTRIERQIGEIELQSENLGHARRVVRQALDALAESADLGDEVVVQLSRLAEIESDIATQVSALRKSAAALVDDAQALRRTTNRLQRGLTGIRMQKAAALFERLAPRVRAMARAEGKRVKLQILGGDTEFDKAVAEQVGDALVQLLRNAVAHGIESAEQRRAAGKPEAGVITLAARGEGESVAIEVADDGAGLDTPALRQRLIELGAWSRERAESESDEEVLRAVFFSNVSSRSQAGLLAGRGVGLGAVRETVARLGGEIRLHSTPGQGTTFTVKLPLTTAVANALLFKVGGQVYAVPNVNVVETAMIEASGPAIPNHLRIRGQAVPLILLHEVLGAAIPADARTVPAVVVEYLGRQLAITCDKIVGPREIVVKSLGPLLSAMPLYAGGTVSGSGKVQLILDPATLVRLAYPTLEVLASDAPPRSPRAGEVPRRLLVVDDSRSVREALTRALERSGFVVDVAPDGAAAWERLCSSTYDAMVTDLEMPELDGFGLIEKLRAGPMPQLVTVVITSQASDENRARAAELGVAALLAKPVSPRAVAEALERGRS